MHETLHAFLAAKGMEIKLQHEEIMTNYVTQMANSLKQLFPSLNNNGDDAKNLALGGLQNTNTFKNTIATDLHLSGSFEAAQEAYSIGSKGTRCN